jgi:hypothetical protein
MLVVPVGLKQGELGVSVHHNSIISESLTYFIIQ